MSAGFLAKLRKAYEVAQAFHDKNRDDWNLIILNDVWENNPGGKPDGEPEDQINLAVGPPHFLCRNILFPRDNPVKHIRNQSQIHQTQNDNRRMLNLKISQGKNNRCQGETKKNKQVGYGH